MEQYGKQHCTTSEYNISFLIIMVMRMTGTLRDHLNKYYFIDEGYICIGCEHRQREETYDLCGLTHDILGIHYRPRSCPLLK